MTQELVFRLCFAAILAVNLAISGYFRRKAHQASGKISRSAEDRSFIVMRLVFTLPLLGSMMAYIFLPGLVEFAAFEASAVLRSLGVALGAACAPFGYWIFTSIGKNISETVLTKERHELVMHGPYRWVRHPLYTNGILLLVSLSLISANLLIAGLGGLALSMLPRIISREEAELTAKFGEAYRGYRERTGAVFPRLAGG